MQQVFEWFGAVVIALGGAGAIILGLSKWFGNIFANKLLEKDKAKYSAELEDLKSKYQHELEARKDELEKSKVQYLRYKEHQFSLYNDLWKSLCDLRYFAEQLWEKADVKRLKEFSTQLASTTLSVEKSALLIEETHFEQLTRILDTFANFKIGKLTLINLRNDQVHDFDQFGINESSIGDIINENRRFKNEFKELLVKLSKSFKNQIKGS